MVDAPPLLFRTHLGGLRPANLAAEKAFAALGKAATVRIEIKRTRGNAGRMAVYWITLAKAAPVLSEMCQGDALDEALLHRVLKDRRGLFTETVLPSGEIIKNYDSISFHKMTEPQRSEYVSWAFETLAKWIGCTVDELTAKD